MRLLSVAVAGTTTYAVHMQTFYSINKGYLTDIIYMPPWAFNLVMIFAMRIFTLTIVYDTFLYIIAVKRDDYAKMIKKDCT